MSNVWVEKSIKLANGKRYLDRLSKIYPVGDIKAEDRLSPEEVAELKKLYRSKNMKAFLTELLALERFPYDEPYVGFLRTDMAAIARNPATVKRITDRLSKMKFDKIVEGANRAKSESRRLGQSFRKWIKAQHKYKIFTDGDAFLKSKGIAFLDGGDKKLKEFSKKHFGYRRKKGLDFVALAYGTPIIGEAKFISTGGGTQDKSFREGIQFLGRKSGKTLYIAVLDGVIWITKEGQAKTSKNLYSTIRQLKAEKIAISALLLPKFLETFKK